MAENRSLPLSVAAADWLLEAFGNDRLYQVVMAVPALHDSVFRGGFQPAPATLAKPAVRRRLRAILLGRFERVEPLLREAAGAPWSEAAQALQALADAWLCRHWRSLLRGTGNPAIAVAMAIDSRPGIRARGLRLLRREFLWGPGWQARPEELPADLRCLVPTAAGEPATPAPAVPRVVGAGSASEHDLAVLRDALGRHREKLRESDQALRHARLEWEQHEKDLRRDLREARAVAQQASSAVEARVADGMAAFRQDALGITPESARLTEASAAPAVGTLLERAERVLEAQRRQNELHGTYATLRARIRELAGMAQRLGACVDESVKVLPEVRSVHAAICREVDRLQALLPGGEPSVAELATQLVARIKEPRSGAETLAELDRLERLLGIDVIAELLGADGLRQVRAALDRRRHFVTDTLHGGGEPATAPRRPRELWDVRSDLAGSAQAPVRVFVDGYNMIRRVPELAACEESGGLGRGRQALCELCRCRARLLLHLEVVFDGAGALSAREECDGLTVVFSNGLRDSQNADDYLRGRVAKARTEGGAVWLVTDDRGLRSQAEPHCDAFIGCADWYRFLC
jgi:hypothetical protein